MAMMYPGGGAAVFLASVLTHAAVAGAISNGKDDREQREADKALVDYQDSISNLSHARLAEAAIANQMTQRMFSQKHLDAGVNTEKYLLESVPVFYLAPDHKSLLVDNYLQISNVESGALVYQNLVRSIVDSGDENKSIGVDQLFSYAADAFSISLAAAVIDIENLELDTQAQKTFRYNLAGERRFERGTLIDNACRFTVIRTLRNSVMTFPKPSNQVSDCAMQLSTYN
ncbi:hypothetical protein [Zhongshania sp.]|uniref:hypothetical protein n=1 Tax=Zhongshania sp. TaxID=1971902 RepID=UPI001B43A083|nr:hypothetical protein [Zhongshania sp.]MBQ0797258.1 hypothetical protein [Zhongshania sp.]